MAYTTFRSRDIGAERLIVYYSLYLSLTLSPLVESVLKPYGGYLILLISGIGAIFLGLNLKKIFIKVNREEIMGNYWKSFILVYLGVLIGSFGIYIAITKNNFILALLFTVVPYLIEILGAFLFRVFCYDVSHYLGIFSSKNLGNYAIIVTFIYPAVFLMKESYSTLFLTFIYVVGLAISYRFFKSFCKSLAD